MTSNVSANLEKELSPADLFLELAILVAGMTSYQRLTAEINLTAFKENVDAALLIDSGQDAYRKLQQLLFDADVGACQSQKNGHKLMVMYGIDALFYLIHPRSLKVPPSKTRNRLPQWLKDLQSNRFVYGSYAQNQNSRLIARGPLQRRDRDEIDLCAESFMDRFVALCIVPKSYLLQHRTISIKHIVVGLSIVDGVDTGKKPGHEEIAFIPVAEKREDLILSSRVVTDQQFVDVKLNPRLDAANIMHRAAINAGMVDICFAPELVTSEDSADGLSKKLTAEPSLVRMIIAGSGHTKTLSADSIAWNEARILNGKGYELWRQRKMWPAGLTRDIAIKYGFDVPVSDLTMEDNAASRSGRR